MEMFDLRADYKTLPDETLRRHFRRLIKGSGDLQLLPLR